MKFNLDMRTAGSKVDRLLRDFRIAVRNYRQCVAWEQNHPNYSEQQRRAMRATRRAQDVLWPLQNHMNLLVDLGLFERPDRQDGYHYVRVRPTKKASA